jgi:hypothetical protein
MAITTIIFTICSITWNHATYLPITIETRLALGFHQFTKTKLELLVVPNTLIVLPQNLVYVQNSK